MVNERQPKTIDEIDDLVGGVVVCLWLVGWQPIRR